MVLPLFDEDSSWLDAIPRTLCDGAPILVIAVVNAPTDADPGAKARTLHLHDGLVTNQAKQLAPALSLVNYASGVDLLVCDCCSEGRQLPSGGVGLARKLGCDLALSAMTQGRLEVSWIATSDADVTDYLAHLGAQTSLTRAGTEGAAILPFRHVVAAEPDVVHAHQVYELSLWHYVLGLAAAGSPYAFHTIGSTLLVHAHTYAQVRGFPKRTGGEDFHLLAKVRKVAAVQSLTGPEVPIRCRTSARTPFGTGPAVSKLMHGKAAGQAGLFYAPDTFRVVQRLLVQFRSAPFRSASVPFPEAMGNLTDNARLVEQLAQWGAPAIRRALLEQGLSDRQFLRQWHAWFDGLKTLRLIRSFAAGDRNKLTLDEVVDAEAWLDPKGSLEDWLAAARDRWLANKYSQLGIGPLGQA